MGNNGCPLPAGSLVWAYCRDSGGDDQDITSQKAAVLEYMDHHNLVLQRLFVDEARPGSSVVGREAFEEMIYLSQKEPRPVDAILLWSFSRFARNLLDAQFYRADLRRRGYEIISISDDLPGGDFDPIIEALIDWKNERYLKDLSRNVKRGLHDLAKQGFSTGGFPPRGYKVEKVQIGVKRTGQPRYASRWVPDPRWAPVVQKAFRMKAQGVTNLEILEETDLFNTKNSLTWFFRNKTYVGIRKCGQLEVPDAHESLIDNETWDQVQARLVRAPEKGKNWPNNREHPARAASPYLLTGLIRCAHCGSAMIGRAVTRGSRRGKRWRCYLCGRKNREGWAACQSRQMGAEMVEAEVMRKVLDRVLDPAYLARLLQEVNTRFSQDMEGLKFQIADTERALAKTNKAITALLDLAEAEGSAAAVGRLKKREEEKTRLETRLRRLRTRLERGTVTVPGEVFAEAVHRLRENLQDGSILERRRVLNSFVQKIEVGNQRGTLYYTFPLYTLALDDVVYVGSTPGAIRTRAHGSGGRCSIH